MSSTTPLPSQREHLRHPQSSRHEVPSLSWSIQLLHPRSPQYSHSPMLSSALCAPQAGHVLLGSLMAHLRTVALAYMETSTATSGASLTMIDPAGAAAVIVQVYVAVCVSRVLPHRHLRTTRSA